ncbi:MAG: UDP-4-amino-4,6-dideoxy-N-acetyl-beta-L-altrosamine transaminase [Balneolaceae bacterium]|nr:MAG: UDP-4-amino-4,6-dideoxy-N-acetyl-beta-L-altrosamine transaminase [Balneolaceae bacterium]
MQEHKSPIPYGRQQITDEDINEVIRVLKTDYLTQGPEIEAFEQAFAAYVGSKFAVAVSNGTAALHLCALALEVKEGSKVITTPLTFAASGNCILYCGGEVVFADIDPETWLIDIEHVKELLHATPEGTYQGIIPVDFTGRPVNLEAFRKLADEHGLWIIEDACHAPGGWFLNSEEKRSHCGSGKYADLAIFSFHPVKHIAAGEGGMITTDNPELYKKLLSLRTHGIIKDDDRYLNSPNIADGRFTQDKDVIQKFYPGWYMEMQDLGYNYRLTDFQAALGRSQLLRADEGLNRRKEIAKRYDEAFKDEHWLIRQAGFIDGHAYHLYVVEVEDRKELYDYLRLNKIFAQIHYIPLHLMPYYRNLGWKPGDLPNVEKYYSSCISLPLYPSLSDEQQLFVIETIRSFYDK